MGNFGLEFYLRKAGLTKGRIIIMERGRGVHRFRTLKNDRHHRDKV